MGGIVFTCEIFLTGFETLGALNYLMCVILFVYQITVWKNYLSDENNMNQAS